MSEFIEGARADFYTSLPSRVKRELDGILFSRKAPPTELHLKIGGASSVFIGGERISLSARLNKNDLEALFQRLTENSLFAYRDSISSGYITLRGGVRVGVVGQARYDGGRLVGISNISALCFRIPSGVFTNKDELLRAFFLSRRGLLIYSPPGAGKTSALRALSYALACGREGKKIAVVDERLEFFPEDYLNVRVDLLRGYKKCDGLEIALRTLAPEVIMLDEIGSESEALAMLSYLNSGVKIVATAHAESYSELLKRKSLRPFFEYEIFDVFFGLKRIGGEFFCEVVCENA
jgi:stage III sporulation protein AA